MEKKRSRTKSQKIAYWIVLISFAAPLLYYLIQMVLGVFDTVNLLTMLQCTLGLFRFACAGISFRKAAL